MASEPQRDDCPWVPVEGWKQVEEMAERVDLELLLYCGREEDRPKRLIQRSQEAIRLSKRLMKLLSGVETPQGVMAFAEKPEWGWEELAPMVLYLEGAQDPGNLGTLLRTAQATASSIVTGPKCVSFFNRKVVRASSAALFSTPFRQGVPVEELTRRGYGLWAAEQGAGESLFSLQFELPLAVVLGGEGPGLSPEALSAASLRLHLPMQPGCESLNLSVAGSLILYWAYQQRGAKGAEGAMS